MSKPNIIQLSDHVGWAREYLMQGARIILWMLVSKWIQLEKRIRFGRSIVIEYYCNRIVDDS